MKNVILIGVQFTIRQISKYRIDALSKNFNFEYWDCSAIIRPHYKNLYLMQEEKYVRIITTFSSFIKIISRIPNDSIVVIDFNPDANLKLTWLLSLRFPKVVRFDFWATTSRTILTKMGVNEVSEEKTGELVVSAGSAKYIKKVKSVLYKSLYIKHFVKIIGVLLRNWNNNIVRCLQMQWNAFKYEIVDQLIQITWISTDKNSKYPINLFDYECYLEDRNKERIIPYKYACFLDVNYPHLPDLLIHENNVDWDRVAQEYYSSMNKFFDIIEKEYQLRVVIAAHPSTNMSENPWNGRQCIVYKTSELVKDCEFAMIHCSNSISYAFLYNKPLLILDNLAVRQSTYISNLTLPYSMAFKISICDTDTCLDIHPYLNPIDRDIHKRFLTAFFNMDNPKKNSELIPQHIESIYKDWYEKK